MSSMRDMYVGITFQDNASRALNTVDHAMDVVERSVHGLGLRLDDASDEFRSMGRVGVNAVDNIEDSLDDAEREARGFSRAVENSGDALGGLKRMAAGLGGVIAGAFAVDKIKDFATSGIELAAGTKALNSQFEQVFGLMELTAQAKLNNIADETGVLSDRLKGSFVQMAAFAKTTGADTAEALALSERATLAAADSAAFYDRSIEDVTDNLQSFLKGNFENDAALGISATETTRNAKANELYGKSFTKLSEAQKQLTLMAMVEDGNKAAGAIGQAARESDGFENVIGNLKGAWDGLKGTMMTPFLDTVTDSVQDLTEKMQGVDAEEIGMKMKSGFDTAMEVIVPTFGALKDGMGWVIDNKDPLIAGVSGIAAGFAALKVISFVNGLLTLYQGSAFASTVATQGFNAALRANPIGMVVTAVGLLVAGGIALYQNWDTVKLKAGELWTTTTEKFAGIKQSVSDFVQPSITWFDSLTGKWDSFKSSITNFKMPAWVSSVGDTIGGAVNKVTSFVNGSHATGLANVPFDGYQAELHKGEAVLTAAQSDGLRAAGILSQNSDGTPNLNFPSSEENENPMNLKVPALSQPTESEQKSMYSTPSGLPQTIGNVNAPPSAVNNESYENNQSSISVPVSLSVTVNATAEKAHNIERKIRELVPRIVQQAISDILDEDLQTL